MEPTRCGLCSAVVPVPGLLAFFIGTALFVRALASAAGPFRWDKRLTLTARVTFAMNPASARRSLSAIR